MMNEWVNVIKNCALEAVDANKPTKIAFGVVESISPLKVLVGQKLGLSEEFLVLTQTVITNALAVGDKVLLLQMQGGQVYVVVDKLGGE